MYTCRTRVDFKTTDPEDVHHYAGKTKSRKIQA